MMKINIDCYYSDEYIKEINENIKESKEKMCPPSESEHGASTIMISTPMYHLCRKNYGGCFGTKEKTLFISNSIFESNTGGENGLFDLKCLGASFTNS